MQNTQEQKQAVLDFREVFKAHTRDAIIRARANGGAAPRKLKPCPFCGHSEGVHARSTRADFPYFIRCDHCEARGSSATSATDAARGWNLRVI